MPLGRSPPAGCWAPGRGSRLLVPDAAAATTTLSLAATDGYITVPGRDGRPALHLRVHPGQTRASPSSQLISDVQGPRPAHGADPHFKQNDDIKITLTNLGLVQRPDLTDSHTIHWHGFDIPSPLNDGVPEVSVAVPIGKQLTYFYRPHREGTYMYHCHFEDVEHVQMGMTGHRLRAPAAGRHDASAGSPSSPTTTATGRPATTATSRSCSTRSGRTSTTATATSRRSIATDYDPEWFTLNGRCYPQTIAARTTTALHDAPGSRRTTRTTATRRQEPAELLADPGEPRRARAAAAGQPRLPAARDAAARASRCTSSARTPRCSRDGTVDTSYWTNTLYIGPGEARDVLFDAPAYDASRPSGSDAAGTYNVYYFKNRDWRRLSNNGALRARRNDDRGAGVPDPAARPDRREPDLCLSRETPSGRKPAMTYLTRRLGARRRPCSRRAADGSGVADGAAGRRAEGRHGLHTRHRDGTTHTFNLVAEHRLHRRRRTATASSCGATPTPTHRTAAHFQSPGPVLCVTQGETVVVNLTNNLPEASSIVFPGQDAQVTASGGAPGLLTTEAAATGGTVSYTLHRRQARARTSTRAARTSRSRSRWACTARWSCARARARTTPTTAATQFDPGREYLLLLTEIDPDLHHAVETGGTYDFNDAAQPLLHDQRARVPGHGPGQRHRRCCRTSRTARSSGSSRTTPSNPLPALIRMLNAGADNHPFHPHGNHTHADRPGRPAAPQRRHGPRRPSTSARRSAPARPRTSCCRWDGPRDDDWNPTTNPFPVAPPNYRNVIFKDGNTWYSGSPYLGLQGHAADRHRTRRTSAASGTSRCTATR